MGDTNIGAIGGSVSGSAIGRRAIVYNAGTSPVTTPEEYVAKLDALREALQHEAGHGEPDPRLYDAIAALAWLRQHHGDQARPADADQRLGALRRLGKVWVQLVEMAKQLPAGVVAGWIVEAMK
jgi:hypothetical protein